MLVHPCEFISEKLPGGEEFDRNDIEMGHGIYDTEFLGGETDAVKVGLPARKL